MTYKCKFNFDYDDFMGRCYTFELIYKPNKLLASKRRVSIYYDSSLVSDDFDKSINGCVERILNMSEEDLINIAIETIKENEAIAFEKSLNEVSKKLSKFKFELDI